MELFPAIDLYEGKAVRLLRGDYNAVTVYADDPLVIAKDFEACGARCLHLVDLEGAKTGETPNLAVVKRIVENTSLFTEVGGGIRSMEVVKTYLDAGVDRVILGTAAVTDEAFLREALAAYGDRIAVGVDIKDGFVAIKGWTESSELEAIAFCEKLQNMGVSTIICTDISKDGAMQGTNHDLYRTLSEKFSMNITASGGVSSIEDVKRLAEKGLYGAIIGKAYYTGAIDLKEAVRLTKEAEA
ncbi:MAG: 1-(5-phosphoribosyl)-5-[Clostridia bacterium]|nr:1-(5-phosphoribosyl)-5-[(5-phosphoribosylamino)methylideneamino]imidazole-4-carboxamide isomerase [Clostridia bacterium]